MGSPTPNILSEIFLQNLEDKYFDRMIKRHNIKLLARYVDDIIIIFDNTNTNKIQILDNLYNLQKEITLEKEKDNILNYLDLTIEKNQRKGKLEIGIYHKTTSNNITTNSKSRHPYNQKLSTFNSLFHRLITIPLVSLNGLGVTCSP